MSLRPPTPATRRRTRAGAALLAWLTVGAVTSVLTVTSAARAAPQPAPVATTADPAAITDTAATLTGSVTPNEPDEPGAIVFFQYGVSTIYGRTTAEQRLTGTAPLPVSADLTGLAPATTYHYRLVGANGAATTRTADATFTTAPSAALTPPITTDGPPATAVGSPGAPTPASATAIGSLPAGRPSIRIGNGGADSRPTVTAAGAKKPIVRIPLTCASGPTCTGTMALFVPHKVTLTNSRTSISIASPAFSIPSGTRVTLALPITRESRALIAKAKRRGQRVTAAITLDGQPTAAHLIALANHARR